MTRRYLKTVKLSPRLVEGAEPAAWACIRRIRDRMTVAEFFGRMHDYNDTELTVRIVFSFNRSGGLDSVRFDERDPERQSDDDGYTGVNPHRVPEYDVAEMVEAAYDRYLYVADRRRNGLRPLISTPDEVLEQMRAMRVPQDEPKWSQRSIDTRLAVYHAHTEIQAREDESAHERLARLGAMRRLS